MKRIVDRITEYCVRKEIITTENVPWFQYGLEKRISTIVVGVPFVVIAFVISNFSSALSFFATYFFVRKYVGGYHAKTIQGCVVFSLLTELFFLGILPHLLNGPPLLGMLGMSIFLILKLAPYNHPNMHLSPEEVQICKKRTRNRIWIASIVNMIAYLTGTSEIAKGCTVGIAMVSSLLCLGYIHDWRNIHYERKSQKSSENDSHSGDAERTL